MEQGGTHKLVLKGVRHLAIDIAVSCVQVNAISVIRENALFKLKHVVDHNAIYSPFSGQFYLMQVIENVLVGLWLKF